MKSDGGVRSRAKDGYAITEHSFEKPCVYIGHVRRINGRGETASAGLKVHVQE